MGVVNNNRIQRNQKIFRNLKENYKTQSNKSIAHKSFVKVFLDCKQLSIGLSLTMYLMVFLSGYFLVFPTKTLAAGTKEVISGDKEKLIQTVTLISSYTPVIKDMKNDLPASKEAVFIEKPEIIQTKTRAEIEEEKKNEEIKKALETERTVIARDRQLSTTQTITATEQTITSLTFNNANSYAYGFCTWYAASRRPDIPGNWGNAGTWLYSAQNAGRETNSEPRIGAIIVTYESWYGHVGYVENIEGDKVTISEMNFSGWGIVNYRSIDRNNPIIQGYIY